MLVNRNKRGSMLALLGMGSGVLAAIGIGLFLLIRLLGGMHESENATDAGSLSVAKHAVYDLGVTLTPREREDFGDLVDTNGLITLRTYNRVVARAMLIAMNAQDEKTPAALQHAHEVLDLAQTGNDSIGQRLHDVLINGALHRQAFFASALSNSGRMLGSASVMQHVDADFQQSYMERGQPCNVYLDDHYITAGHKNLLAQRGLTTTDAAGHMLVKGYTVIDLGDGLVFAFVPVNPNRAPHLVSQREFTSNNVSSLTQVLPASLIGKLPPNSFMNCSAAVDDRSRCTIRRRACSIVGALNKLYPASLPSAYVEVVNPKGYAPPDSLPSTNNWFAKEGMTGTFLFADSNGLPVAFSTDPYIGEQWRAYNANPQGTMPPRYDEHNNPLVFDSSGQPAGLDVLTRISGNAGPLAGCNVMNTVGDGSDASCRNTLPGFLRAFPGDPSNQNGDRSQLIAVEKYQGNMLELYGRLINAGLVEQGCGYVEAPKAATGLRLFDRNAAYGDDFDPKFSTPGTVPQLLTQVGNGAYSVVALISQRIHQIKPEATQAEIDNLLNNTTIELDSIKYIYMIDDTSRQLVFSATPPKTLVTRVAADGQLQAYSSGSYTTLYKAVNAYAANGLNIYFMVPPPVNSSAIAADYAYYTPSSGYRGNLGSVRFENTISGGGTFCKPN